MARRVFFSFHFEPDNWRASQIRNMGAIEGNPAVSDNDWEAVKRGGDQAIKNWISRQMTGRSCVVVLIGSSTAGRKWVTYEISTGWMSGKGVLGIYVHKLKDVKGLQSAKGADPFASLTLGHNGPRLSAIVRTYDPQFATSTTVYNHISANIASWVERAIAIRAQY